MEVDSQRHQYVFEALPLREYQKEGLRFLLHAHKAILGDDMGLGKTLQILGAAYLISPKKILIICTKSGLSVWQKEVDKWLPEWSGKATIIEGSTYKRAKLWLSNPFIAICTYQSYRIDAQCGRAPKNADLVICDEAHKMRNRKTLAYKLTRTIACERFIAVTGSPAKRGAQDLWTLISLCHPKMFPSYWRFVNTFCIVEDGFFGREIIGMKNTEQLRKLINPFFLRRSKKDPNIASQLPPKLRHFLPTQLSKQQIELYGKIAEDGIVSLGSSRLVTPTVLAQITRLRQLLICPKVLDPALGYGSGIESIMEHIEDQELDRAAIFSLYPSTFPFLKEYIESLGYSVRQLRGGTAAEEVKSVVNWFNGTKRIVLCSILFAESFDLVQASAGYVLGASYDVEENKQAEDRLHRLNSPEAVNIYYIRFPDTIDDAVFDILDTKAVNITHVLKSPEEAEKLLRIRPKKKLS